MNWRLGLTLALLLAAVASGWSVWRLSRPAEPELLKARPDYVLHDFEMTSLDKTGAEAFTLRGPLLERDPREKSMALATPLFLVPDKAGQYWEVRADHGVVPSDGERLDLSGHVIATSPAQAPPPTRIATAQLTLFPRQNRASSSAAVVVTRPGHTMRGVGMQADFDRQRVSLLSEVKHHYVPQP